MKTLFAFIFIAFLASSAGWAQTPAPPERPTRVSNREAGIKAGVNIASISNLVQSDVYMGFHAGFFGNVEVDQHFGYGAEVNFSKQGVTIDNQDLALNYISVPVMLNLLEGPVTFQGGVYGAVFLNARIRNGQAWKDLTPYFQDTDYGIVLGLNFYPAGPTFISARFNLGLHNINDNLTKPADAVLKNRNIQLSGGYRF